MRKAGWIFIGIVIVVLFAIAFVGPVRAAVFKFFGNTVAPAFGTTASNIVNSPFWQTYIKPNAVFFGIFYGIVIVAVSMKLFDSVRKRLPSKPTLSTTSRTLSRPSTTSIGQSAVTAPTTPITQPNVGTTTEETVEEEV